MNAALYQKLFSEAIAGGMQCAGRLANITHYLLQTSKLDGAMVEFGCNAGRTAALMACVCPEKELWLYDSFQGLPKPTEKDSGQFGEGLMKALTYEVERHFGDNRLKMPRIIQSWFKGLTPTELPAKISFAHLDGDLYESIRDSIKIVIPRMTLGGIVVIDDWGWSVTPGVAIAVQEFMDTQEGVKGGVWGLPIHTGNPNSAQVVLHC